jgi:predicted deacylase
VEPGHPFAIRRNGFGEVIAESMIGASGEVLGLRSDAMAKPGNPLAFILFNAPGAEQTQVYPE